MINLILGLIFTFLTGLFFLVGIIILKNQKYQEKISLFIYSLAFVVMIGLLFFDLLPEIIGTKNLYLIIPIIIGFLTLIVIDKLIPHHHHEHQNCDRHDHEEHLNHIGIITIIALAIHNMLEGLTLYNVTVNNSLSGLLMMISISLHNIPLGFQIGSSLKAKKYSKILLGFLCLSSFLGALIMIFFGTLNEQVVSILLALTFGMLLYILFFELFNEIKTSLKKKDVIYGIIVGGVILIITLLV